MDGSRTEVTLPGKYGSERSKQEYERLLCQLRATGSQMPSDTATKDITIAELVERFMSHAETYYVDPVTKARTSSKHKPRDDQNATHITPPDEWPLRLRQQKEFQRRNDFLSEGPENSIDVIRASVTINYHPAKSIDCNSRAKNGVGLFLPED